VAFSAVVSLLDLATRQKVESHWDYLEENCGLTGIRITPYPHISWQVAEKHDLIPLKNALATRARMAHPLSILTTGLGMFSGPTPVLYLPIVKNPSLMDFHRQVWEETLPFAHGVNLKYHPDAWIPHITLAYKDIHHDNIGCIMQEYAFKNFDWHISLDNLALVAQEGEEVGVLKERYNFNTAGSKR